MIPETETSRYLIFYHKDALADTAKIAEVKAGISMLNTAGDAEYVTASDAWKPYDTIVVPSLGVAICSATPEQMERLQADLTGPIKYIRKEMIFSIAASISADYLRGYQAATNNLIEQLLNGQFQENGFAVADGVSFHDNNSLTWGLQSIGVGQTQFTGKGIKVAVLDTGIDFTHPDFQNRNIQSQSFVAGAGTAMDDNGHGTHCIGTLCGPVNPFKGPRYGIAPDAELFVGKVMNAAGLGNEGDIIHGMGWALQNNCRIISLSLGKAVQKGDDPIIKYEEIGQAALDQNCLIIAAAGNDSHRPGVIAPVAIPANSTTILAVGAIDNHMAIYNGSNAGINAAGGAVDIAGPGVEVYSSKLAPLRYGNDTGTSMATPHVSGVAALMMEADPSATAVQIWTKLTQNAKAISLTKTDVGGGLVQIK